MPWAWIAIRLTARSLLSEPSRSLTRAVGRPKPRRARRDLDRDEVAVLRVGGRARRDRELAAELLLVDRREPAAAAGQRAEDAEHALLGAVEDLDDAAGVADRRRRRSPAFLDPQQRAVADAGDLAGPRLARDVRMRIFGGAPCASSSHSVGTAISSPSRSRAVMSASTTWGRVPGRCSFLRRRSTRPSSASSRSMCLSVGAVGVLQAEGARDLAGADLAGLLADEGEDVVLGGEGRFGGGACHE